MTSEVSICNQALGWLGQTNITSFEDKTRTAQLCRDNYPELRDAVLESRCWTFAEIRVESTTENQPGLVEGTSKTAGQGYPEWGDGWVHDIPEEFLAVFRVYKDISTSRYRDARWTRHNQYVIADEPTVYMWGVRRIENTNQYPKLFVQALAARLAADLCIPITQNRQLQADMWALYEAKLGEAAVRDGQQARSEELYANRLISNRFR